MSLIKYIDRMKRMDNLIRKKATGNPDEFSRKMGICKSVLMDHIREMKCMGAPINYSSQRQSYYYDQDCKLVVDFLAEDMVRLKGGMGNSYSFEYTL